MDVNTQIRDLEKQLKEMKKSHITQAQVDDLQTNLADLTQECSELKNYFSENPQKLKEIEARVKSARDRSLNVQQQVETIAKQAHHRDSTVQALGDKVEHHWKQFESKIDREKEMEKKLKILIKEYKHIKSSLGETMQQKERAEANLQDVKDLFRDQVVANKQRDRDMKQLKDTVTQQGYELQKLKTHMNDRQLHSDNSGLLMAERNETDVLTTERKISPSSTGTTLSTDGMGTEITKLHKIRKTRSFQSFHHIDSHVSENDSPIKNPSSSLQDELQLPPLVHSATNTTTTTTTTTVTKPKKRGQHQSLKLHSVAIQPPTQTHDNQSRRMSYPSITPIDKKD